MMDRAALRSFILSVVKPLKSGHFVSQSSDTSAELDNLAANSGSSKKFRLTFPFGFVSGVPRGVAAFYTSLISGSAFENIILGQVHLSRPSPTTGQSIQYATDADGQNIVVTISANPDGTLVITANGKVTVNAPEVDIGSGSLKKALIGEIFQETFNNHTHIGNLGTETSVPVVPSSASDLSTVLKTT